MSREQIWCADGHYLDLDVPERYVLAGITVKGGRCLVRGCKAKIEVRNFVEGTHQVGCIPPVYTDDRNELQAQELLSEAEKLRAEAAAMEAKAARMETTARDLKLYKIPNLEKDQTEIDPEKYLEWFRNGDPESPPRVPRQKAE